MSDTYAVKITATDTASPVFRSIAGEARKADSALDGIGAGGLKALQAIERNTAEAAASLKDYARATQEAEKATAGFNKGAAAAGAAAGTLVLGIGRLGQSYINQQRQVTAIGRVYGDQADEILEFAEALQKSTTFSNDAARQAALTTGSLVQNYGFQAAQVKNLISLGADYAALYGLELPDAVERLTAAMRGEGEAAEALGLTLSDSNVARFALQQGVTNYSSGLDEAGRATLRYALLLQQTSTIEGYAGELAQTRAGQVAQYVNQLQDIGQQVGGALGPLGEVAAIAANYGPSFILASGAVGGFIGQIKTAASAVNGFKIGSLAIGAAAGPIGLLAAGLGLVAVGFAKAAENAQRADLAVAGVKNSIAQAFANGLFPEDVILNTSDQVSEAISKAMSELDGNEAGFNFDSFSGFAASTIGALYEAFIGDPRLTQIGNEVSKIINYGFTSGADNAGLVVDELYNLNSAYSMGAITLDQYSVGITSLAGNLDAFGLIVEDENGKFVVNADLLNKMSQATIELASAQDMAAASIQSAIDLQDRLGVSQRTTIENQIALLREGQRQPGAPVGAMSEEIELLNDQLDELTQARAQLANELENTFRSNLFGDLPGMFGDIEDGFQTLIDDAAITQAQADEMSAAFDRVQASGASMLEVAIGMADALGYAGTAAGGFAVKLYGAVDATNGVLGLYDAIDNLGGVLEKANGIANELFGEGGDAFDGVGPLVDMLNNGTISQEQYNNAVEAGLAIQADNVRGQEALNAVRANLLPLLADQTEELANYYEELAQGSAAEQQRALYLGDTANQQKLLNIQSAIYAESIGELPTNVATQLIVDAANADPVLKQFLLDTKQITEDPITGEIRVNFPDGESMTGTITTLNDTLETLGSLIAEINGLPDPFSDVATGADDATISTDNLTASTRALWEAMGAPIPPPPPPPGPPASTPGLTGGGPAGGVGGRGPNGEVTGFPGDTPPNIPATPRPNPTPLPAVSPEVAAMWARLRGETPQPGAFPAVVPGASPIPPAIGTRGRVGVGFDAGLSGSLVPIGRGNTAPPGAFPATPALPAPYGPNNLPPNIPATPPPAQGGTANTVISLRTVLDDGATPGLERLGSLTTDLDGRQALLDALANDEASPKLNDVRDLFGGLNGKSATLLAKGDSSSAVAAATDSDSAFSLIDGVSALLFANGDNSSAVSRAAEAGGVFAGIDGKSALLFANGDSSGAEAAASAGAAAIAAMDGTTGSVYAQGVDNYSGTINAAKSYDGVVLATSYIDTYIREFKQSGISKYFANGGVLGYADGGVLPTAALGRVLVGENGPEIATLPGGTLITPSPASQQLADRMMGGGGLVVNNYFTGTYIGIDDFMGDIAAGINRAVDMQDASLGAD